jgi:AcrR family transcriptional regulator
MDQDSVRTGLLDAAEWLFYSRGIQSVGMDDLRDAAGLSLKRLYQLYGSKGELVEAVLRRRDVRLRQRLAEHVDTRTGAENRILAVFDWLSAWFDEHGFRGCAWINSFGELGAVSPVVARLAREHKAAFRQYLAGLVADADLPAGLTDELLILAEGAIVTASIFGTTEPAAQARAAARTLILVSRSDTRGIKTAGQSP